MLLQNQLLVLSLGIACSSCMAREQAPPMPDVTPPTVAIISPSPAGCVADTAWVQIAATDDQGVARVTLAVDGVTVGRCYREPWNIPWATAALPDSSLHVLTAEGVDESGNLALSDPCEVRVIENHAPEVTILWPPDGLWIDLARAQLPWQCRASDPNGDRLEIHWALDAAPLEALGPSIPPHDLAVGEHRIAAIAADRWGRRALCVHTVCAFQFSQQETPGAVWQDFIAALGARDASAAIALLAPEYGQHPPWGGMWRRDEIAAALTGILADSTLQILKIAAAPPSAEIFTLQGRKLAKLEVRELSVEWAGCNPETARAVCSGAARIFLTRTGGPWQIITWWDLHGATWAPGGELSWSALLNTKG